MNRAEIIERADQGLLVFLSQAMFSHVLYSNSGIVQQKQCMEGISTM